ncbi:MAG: hypothetical protein C0594_03815 [Marinilabiliales bacterium]|nr:MAG: hypothetical protein C0594_03815 [Marinilabiliales bacterium]
MDKSGKLLLIDPITIMNDNILTSGYFDINTTNNQVTIYGDWVNNGGNFICRYGTVLFTGGGLQEFNKKLDGTVNLSDFNFYNVTINSPDVQFFYDSDNHKVNIINNLVINYGMKISNLDQ